MGQKGMGRLFRRKIMKFPVGLVFITQGVQKAMREDDFRSFIYRSLSRHADGDWGDLSEIDKKINERALKSGGRLLSAYKYNKKKIWIITEGNRAKTTILFPSEY